MSTATATATDVQAFVSEAAEAALAVLPLPVPGTVTGVVHAVEAPDFGSDSSAVSVRFTGAVTGTVVIVLGEAALSALASGPDGALDPVDALRPALETAVATLGPCTLEAGAEIDPADALAVLAEGAVALIGDDNGTLALLGLTILAQSGPTGTTGSATGAAGDGQRRSLDLLRDVQMDVTVELGRTSMTVQELLALSPGSVVELDRAAGSPADILVNGQLIARGEVVVIDEDYASRVTEIVTPGTEAGA
jgi:flagellar motor switch protein FliN/FliY